MQQTYSQDGHSKVIRIHLHLFSDVINDIHVTCELWRVVVDVTDGDDDGGCVVVLVIEDAIPQLVFSWTLKPWPRDVIEIELHRNNDVTINSLSRSQGLL